MAAARTTGRELLTDLVSIPSPSGEEAEAAERLAAFFEERGRDAWIDEVGNVRAPGDDGVLLTSHIDTVPGEIPVEVKDGELWGRGSVDATGPLAAMAVAAVETGASFAGVVGEETDSRGARHLIETRDAPDAVINGEPSGWNGVTLGYRGILMGTYATATEGMHSSRPEPNAVQRAMAWWADAEAAFESEGSVFEGVTAKPVGIDGGLAADGLAMEATIDMQFRIPPGTTAEEVRATVEGVEPRSTESESGRGSREGSEGEHEATASTRCPRTADGGEVEWTDAIPPVMESPRSPVARAFRAAIRQEGGEPRLLRKTGTSDMNLFAGAWDGPMATYGPGDSSLDHAPDERLDLGEFDRSVAVLTRVADSLLGGGR